MQVEEDVWCTISESMKITSSCKIYKTIYHSVCDLLLFGNKKMRKFWNVH